MSNERIRIAERNLTVQLNYGGIFVNGIHSPGHITLEYQQGDLVDEVGHMRRFAEAFSELADAIESD